MMSPHTFQMNRRYVRGLLSAIIGLTCSLTASVRGAGADTYDFHQERVLGTSLDLQIVAANAEQAKAASKMLLEEIERLRLILSNHDEGTDLWKVNHSSEAVKVAPELVELLGAYEAWALRTKGVFNGQMGELIRLWQAAEKNGTLPDQASLAAAVDLVKKPAWKINVKENTVTCLGDQQINVDALGKSFIVDRAVQSTMAKASGVKGLLLNIGGDIMSAGNSSLTAGTPWKVAVADPAHPAENAAPIAQLQLHNMAVVTSGAYERYYDIGGKHYSHILDPRTGMSSEGIASATVIAHDAATANALSTALCVLSPEEGLKLINTIEYAECLIVDKAGKQFRSAGLARFERPWMFTAAGRNTLWPLDHELTVNFTVKRHPEKVSLRPYVAVWVEDTDGRIVRTVELWCHPKKSRYLRDCRGWWKFGRWVKPVIPAITRATRPAGEYSVAWDGLDSQGNPLPPGEYKICLEVCYEDGDDCVEQVKIQCGEHEAKAALPETTTFSDATVAYTHSKH